MRTSRILKDSNGKIVNPINSAFPIITGDNKRGTYDFVGTGFFVSPIGAFVTAKHVMYNKDGSPINPFLAIQIIEDGRAIVRPIYQWTPHPQADLAFGLLAPKKYAFELGIWVNCPITVTPFTISTNEPNLGDIVTTFAFPKSSIEVKENKLSGSFNCVWEMGEVEEYFPNGRDSTFLPSRCYQTSMLIEGGASGGPVLFNGKVIGVNSTGYDNIPVSFISPIAELLELMVLNRGQQISVRELAEKGNIAVDF